MHMRIKVKENEFVLVKMAIIFNINQNLLVPLFKYLYLNSKLLFTLKMLKGILVMEIIKNKHFYCLISLACVLKWTFSISCFHE